MYNCIATTTRSRIALQKQKQLLFNKAEIKNQKQQQIAKREKYIFYFLCWLRSKKLRFFVHLLYEKKETVWFCYYVVVLCLLYACSFMASKESRVKQKGELLKNIVRYYSGREL